ncbi:MAG: hypothetical protein HUJ42_03030 [Malacoplasma sp.]|mgnify:CR=1 FL=1|nr:hypothetical protein [Malacoplasma sp.]
MNNSINKKDELIFLKNINTQKAIMRLKKTLNSDNRPYIITIKAILDFFNEPIKDELIIDEITDIIHNLITSYKQPYYYLKSTIRQILTYSLPYSFFLVLSKSEALRIYSSLKKYNEAIVHAFIKKPENRDFTIISWTSNFYKIKPDFYSNYNQQIALEFFEFFSKFLKANSSNTYDFFSPKIALENYGTNPIVLLKNLQLEEAICIVYHFQHNFNNLPFDLLITDTRSLERQSQKVKPLIIAN